MKIRLLSPLFTAFFVIICLSGRCQPAPPPVAPFPGIIWQTSLGGSGFETIHSLEPLSDGGFIAAGETSSRDGDIQEQSGKGDALIIRYNASGTVVWHKVFGGPESDRAWSIYPTSDGGFIFAGETRYRTDETGYKGSLDAWIVKLSSDGTMEWEECLGGTAEEGATAVRQTSDGGYAVTGFSTSWDAPFEGNNGESDAWVAKLGADGSLAWLSCIGDYGDDIAYDLEICSDGSFILAGKSVTPLNEPEDASFGLGNFLIAKVDAAGSLLWSNSFGGLNDDCAYDVTILKDNSFLLTGFARSHTGDVTGHFGSADVWVVKVTSEGDYSWGKCFGGMSDDIGYQAREMSNGYFLVAGNTRSKDNQVEGTHNRWDAWILVLDQTGNLLKAQVIGGRDDDMAEAAIETSDGDIVFGGHGSVTGSWDVTSGHACGDGWLVKVRF